MTATQLQFRRGSAAQMATFTGAVGEVVVDTTNNRVVVQDGATVGGWPCGTVRRTAVADANYTILTTDRIVAYTAITLPRTATLPAAVSYSQGERLLIVDESGSCSTANAITVSRAGTDTINGGASKAINAAYGFLALESNGANAWTIVASSAAVTLPTVQTFLSSGSSGTYTTPANVQWIEVIAVGGGGGGAGSGTGTSAGSAGNGGNTTFGTSLIVARGGTGGAPYTGSPGTGGTASLGSAIGQAVSGGDGGYGPTLSGVTGANGGNSALGGGGAGEAAEQNGVPTAGKANTGGGGGGRTTTTGINGGGGGGAGGYARAIITSPSASYSYAVGAGGAAGAAGTSGVAGVAGGSGGLWVIEHYGQ